MYITHLCIDIIAHTHHRTYLEFIPVEIDPQVLSLNLVSQRRFRRISSHRIEWRKFPEAAIFSLNITSPADRILTYPEWASTKYGMA